MSTSKKQKTSDDGRILLGSKSSPAISPDSLSINEREIWFRNMGLYSLSEQERAEFVTQLHEFQPPLSNKHVGGPIAFDQDGKVNILKSGWMLLLIEHLACELYEKPTSLVIPVRDFRRFMIRVNLDELVTAVLYTIDNSTAKLNNRNRTIRNMRDRVIKTIAPVLFPTDWFTKELRDEADKIEVVRPKNIHIPPLNMEKK